MDINTFLFDFDGTLVDSMPTYCDIMLGILKEKKVSYSDDIIKIITPLGFKGTARYYIETLGMDTTVEELGMMMGKRAIHEYTYNIPAKNNVIRVLNELKERGADLNILTASPHLTLDPCLKRLGIYDLFTNVWSCEDFSTTKSDPEIYRMAAERIGKRVEDILFLDDNLNADMTAKEAGMRVCGVFDPSSEEYAEEMKALCDMYISDFSQLLKMC